MNEETEKNVIGITQRQYYEELINNKRKARNANETIISRTSEDAGLVLSLIGINHPASSIVFEYFVKANYPNRGLLAYLKS